MSVLKVFVFCLILFFPVVTFANSRETIFSLEIIEDELANPQIAEIINNNDLEDFVVLSQEEVNGVEVITILSKEFDIIFLTTF